MYVPSFDSVLRAIGTDRARLNDAREVVVPVELFKFLLQTALVASDCNETGYLTETPDVAGAVRTGTVDSARLHCIGYGYFEGRKGGMPQVDERWYLAS